MFLLSCLTTLLYLTLCIFISYFCFINYLQKKQCIFLTTSIAFALIGLIHLHDIIGLFAWLFFDYDFSWPIHDIKFVAFFSILVHLYVNLTKFLQKEKSFYVRLMFRLISTTILVLSASQILALSVLYFNVIFDNFFTDFIESVIHYPTLFNFALSLFLGTSILALGSLTHKLKPKSISFYIAISVFLILMADFALFIPGFYHQLLDYFFYDRLSMLFLFLEKTVTVLVTTTGYTTLLLALNESKKHTLFKKK